MRVACFNWSESNRICSETIRKVLDIGCGTGTFACRLAARRIEVIGLEPAPAALKVALTKPWSERITWICGTVGDLPPLKVVLATMTASEAKFFYTKNNGNKP